MSKFSRGKVLGWGVAVATVAAVAVASAVYAAGPQAGPPLSLDSAQMKSVLVPLSEQPSSVFYGEPMTLKDGAASGGFDDPEGMVFAPKSCSSYLEDALGPMSGLDGWMQYGGRDNGGAHPEFFYQAVIKIPGGVDLEKIRASAMSCSLGFMTIGGENKLTGAVTVKERNAPAVSGASSLALVHGTQFPQPANAEEQALLEEMYYGCDIGTELCPVCEVETAFVASGDLLIITYDTKAGYADQLASTMLSNARALS